MIISHFSCSFDIQQAPNIFWILECLSLFKLQFFLKNNIQGVYMLLFIPMSTENVSFLYDPTLLHSGFWYRLGLFERS